MKEKIGKKGITKRLFSVVLALALAISLMSFDTLQASAAEQCNRCATCGHNWSRHLPTDGHCYTCSSTGPCSQSSSVEDRCVLESGHTGAHIATLPHTHDNWSNDWSKNDTTHWHACLEIDCTQKKDEVAHSYTSFSAKDNVLTAACVCGKSVTLTLTASSPNYSGSSVEPTITFGSDTEKQAWTAAGLKLPGATGDGAPTITKTYYSTDASGNKTGTGSTTAPTSRGKYVVEVKVSYGEGKEATVSTTYNVNKGTGATASNEGTTVTAGQGKVTIAGMKENQEYIVSTKSSVSSLTEADWNTTVGSDGIVSNLSDATTYYVYARTKETENYAAGAALAVSSGTTNVAKPANNKTGYSIAADKKITIESDYEVFSDAACTTPVTSGTTLAEGTTYYVRKKASGGASASEALSFSLHSHTWSYTASGASLTAKSTCHTDEECEYHATGEKTLTLTLSASDANYSGKTATITVGTPDEKTAWRDAGLTVPYTKKYYLENGTDPTTTEHGADGENDAPTKAGKYVVKVTYTDTVPDPDVDYTISVPFEIKKHNLTPATTTMVGITLDTPDAYLDDDEIVMICTDNNYSPKNNDHIIFRKVTDSKYKCYFYTPGGWASNNEQLSIDDIKDRIRANWANMYVIGTVQEPHSWTYSVNGATLTATCDKGCGETTAHTATLTLTASDTNYSGSTASEICGEPTAAYEPIVQIAGLDAWTKAVGAPKIEYKPVNGSWASLEGVTSLAAEDYEVRVYPAAETTPSHIVSASFKILNHNAGFVEKPTVSTGWTYDRKPHKLLTAPENAAAQN